MKRRISSTELDDAMSSRACRRIDAVVTWADGRRRADAHVHFLGAGIAQHADDLPAGGAADDGIIDHDHALAFKTSRCALSLILTPKCRIDCCGSMNVRPT